MVMNYNKRGQYSILMHTSKSQIWDMLLVFRGKFFSYEYQSSFLTSVLIFLLAGYFNAFMANIAGYRVPLIKIEGPEWQKGRTTLPDLGHDLISLTGQWIYGQEYSHVDWFALPDRILEFMSYSAIIFICIHPKRFLIFRRALTIGTIMSFYEVDR
eukprot:UN05765